MSGTLIILGLFGPPIIWLAAIRPYARRHGQGYTPGANVGVTAWVDWEQAKAIAKARGDAGMVWICRLFLLSAASFVVGFLSLAFLSPD